MEPYALGQAVIWPEFFTQDEYNQMWNELTMLCQDEILIDSYQAGGAIDPNTKQLLRVNRGLPLESVFEDLDMSVIHTITKRMFDKEVVEKLCQVSELMHYLSYPTKQTNLINHYMGNHKYDQHRDNCVITAITLFWREPKSFTGGDLMIDNVSTNLKPRDLLWFPSFKLHSVTPVEMKQGVYIDNMSGRISLSKFIKVV